MLMTRKACRISFIAHSPRPIFVTFRCIPLVLACLRYDPLTDFRELMLHRLRFVKVTG